MILAFHMKHLIQFSLVQAVQLLSPQLPLPLLTKSLLPAHTLLRALLFSLFRFVLCTFQCWHLSIFPPFYFCSLSPPSSLSSLHTRASISTIAVNGRQELRYVSVRHTHTGGAGALPSSSTRSGCSARPLEARRSGKRKRKSRPPLFS